MLGPNSGGGSGSERDDARVAQLGGYTFGIGADDAVLFYDAVKQGVAGLPISVEYARGANIVDYDTSLIPAAVALAQESDVVFIVVGDNSGGYAATTCGEASDRDDLDVPGGALPLIKAVLDAVEGKGVRVVVVLIHGRAATFGAGALSSVGPKNALLARMPALLAAWRPGQLGGTALWDVITGAFNPSGRLAQTWPRSVGQVHQFVPWYTKAATPSYSYFDEATSPLFAFGFGLSYTKFKVLSAKLSASVASATDTLSVTVTLSSEGPVGQCVVQVYFQQQLSQYVRYNWMLLTFEKFNMPSNSASYTGALVFDVEDMGYYHASSGQNQVDAGEYTIMVSLDSTLAGGVSNTLTVVE